MKAAITLTGVLLTASTSAMAFDWPWEKREDARLGYCQGVVLAGLDQYALKKLSRTDLWLTWNYLNRAELEEGSTSATEVQQGRDDMKALVASADYEGILNITNHECYLGRNRRSEIEP